MKGVEAQYRLKVHTFKRLILLSLITVLVLENIIGSFIFKFISEEVGTLFPYFKYVIFAALSTTSIYLILAGTIKTSKADIYALLYSIWVICFLTIAKINGILLGNFFYLYITPIAIYLSGKFFYDLELSQITKPIVRTALLISIFGIVDLVFFGELFWKDFLAYGDYIVHGKGFSETVIDGLPGNFYYSPYLLKIKRLISTLGDPLATGYFLCTPLLLLVLSSKKKTRLEIAVIIIILIALALTLTRAAIMSFVIAILIYKYARRSGLILSITFSALALFAITQNFGIDERRVTDSSTLGHIASIKDIPISLNINHLMLGSLTEYKFKYFEPGLPNILINFGFIGLTLFLSFIFSLYFGLLKQYPIISCVFAAGMVTLIIFSQSFLSTSASWVPWLLAGWAVAHKLNTSSNRKYDTN